MTQSDVLHAAQAIVNAFEDEGTDPRVAAAGAGLAAIWYHLGAETLEADLSKLQELSFWFDAQKAGTTDQGES